MTWEKARLTPLRRLPAWPMAYRIPSGIQTRPADKPQIPPPALDDGSPAHRRKLRSDYSNHDTATPSVPADHFSEAPIVDLGYSLGEKFRKKSEQEDEKLSQWDLNFISKLLNLTKMSIFFDNQPFSPSQPFTPSRARERWLMVFFISSPNRAKLSSCPSGTNKGS